jgi:hypothetical protein
MENITIQPSRNLLIWQRSLFLVLPLSLLNSALFVFLFLVLDPEHWYWGLFVGLVSFACGLAALFVGLDRELEHFSIHISEDALAGPSSGWYRKCSIAVKDIDRKRTAASLAGRGFWNMKFFWSIYGERIVIIDSMYPPEDRGVLHEHLARLQDSSRAEAEARGSALSPITSKIVRPIVFNPSLIRIFVTHLIFALFGSLAGAVGVLIFSREIAQILWGTLGGFGGGFIGSLALNVGSRWKVTIAKGMITGNPGQEMLGAQTASFFVARVDRARTGYDNRVKNLLMSGRYIWSLEDDRIFLPDFFFTPEDVKRIFEFIGIPDKKD